ncbi:glycosyltransferase family 1 protein [Clostridium sp. AL.422]|uniref:glycosyltransferase family 4 protein n=1 Tax=Clostridium TaxID=1485 RepID=UPI00293DC783|nr:MULTISPECIES: glycosyltransferase family 1 protein [unclassified Clostridium]MDV4149511.1 glycosyltransferase family 1 protein [Clostridium sp. AL.422]
MKIGVDGRAAKWYRGTGIGTYTYQLINSISKVDHTNDYLVYLPENSALDLSDNFNIELVRATASSNFWDEVRVPNILHDNTLDLYHVPQNGVGLYTNINCHKAITLHDIIPLRMPETVSERYLYIFNNELPKIINDCDGILTVSEFSKQDIAKEFNFPEEKIFVTHLAAEDIYRPLDKCQCKEIIKNEYNIEDDFILYVGGFSPRKNIVGLIEAFSLLSKGVKKNLKLVITGKKGISYNIYKKRAIDLHIENDVIFTDFIPLEKLPIFYNASKLLAYPSFYEGFGLPPLEAMACGTPVISSNVTSLSEVCSESALLINPYNIDELKNSIETVLKDDLLRKEMIKKGLMQSSKYSWNITAESTVQAYEKIIKS